MARIHPRSFRQRRRLVLGYALVGVLTGACAAQQEPAPYRVVIVASATANEPAPALTSGAWTVVGKAIDSDRGTLDVLVDRVHGPETVRSIDLVLRRGAEIEHSVERRTHLVAERIGQVDAAVRALAGDSGRIDVLGLLGAVARIPGPATGIVVTSGLQSGGPLGIQAFAGEPVPGLPERAAAAGLLPDLTGKTVIFTSLGDVAGAQVPPTQRLRDQLAELWLGVCREAGATECRVDTEHVSAGPPTSTVAAPLVDVPPDPALAVPTTGTPAVSELPGDLLFAPDSAELRQDAVVLLRDVAARLPADARVLLEGRTATVGEPDAARTFSLRRAQACRDALVGAGVPAEHVSIVGLGFDRPLVPDLAPDGTLLPAAARNRSVTMTITIGGRP